MYSTAAVKVYARVFRVSSYVKMVADESFLLRTGGINNPESCNQNKDYSVTLAELSSLFEKKRSKYLSLLFSRKSLRQISPGFHKQVLSLWRHLKDFGLTDTLVRGQLYLKPRFPQLSITNSEFYITVSGQLQLRTPFSASRWCPPTRASSVLKTVWRVNDTL